VNKIVQYSANANRKVRGTDVKKGDQLFAIQDIDTRLFFIWAYTSREMAEMISKRVSPQSEADRQANWRRYLVQLTPTDTKVK